MKKAEMEKIKVGGKEIEVLSAVEIACRIEELKVDKVVSVAYKGFKPNKATGYACIDIRTGKLVGGSYPIGREAPVKPTEILLYEIPADYVFSDFSIFEEGELQELHEKYNDNIDAFVKDKKINLRERKLDILVDDFHEIIQGPNWLSDIINQVRKLYNF